MSGRREPGIYRNLLYFLWDFSVSLETALIDTTPLCKLNAQVTFPQNSLTSGSYRGLFALVQSGELWLPTGGLWLKFGVLSLWRKTLIFWTKITGLLGLGNHVNVTIWLARFWFILVTLVTCRHLVLTAQAKMRGTCYKVSPGCCLPGRTTRWIIQPVFPVTLTSPSV